MHNTKPTRNIGHYFISKHFHDFIIFFIMDLVNQFVYSMVLYLLARNESFHEIGGFYSFHFGPFIIALVALSKNLRFTRESNNFSAGSSFQFLIVQFTKEYTPISLLSFLSLIFPT